MKIEDNNIIFSTGKVRAANCGIIGISQDLYLSEGYDDGFFSQEINNPERHDFLTKEEQIELAAYMIGLWEKFKDSAR